MILVIIMNAIFALTFSTGKKALLYSSPLMLSFGRTAVTAIILLSLEFIKNRSFPRINKTNLILLLSYSVTLLISFLCGNWALAHITSIKSALFYAMAPLITATISYFIFKDHFNYYKTTGVIIGLIGMLLICTSNLNQTTLILQRPGLPELILALAVIAYASSWFLVKPLVTKNHYNSIYINGLASLVSSLICLFIIFITKQNIPIIPAFWIWTCLQALISGVICYTLYMYLLNFYSASFLSFSGFSEPIFAAIYGWVLLDEKPLVIFWIATILISIGLFLFYRGETRH